MHLYYVLWKVKFVQTNHADTDIVKWLEMTCTEDFAVQIGMTRPIPKKLLHLDLELTFDLLIRVVFYDLTWTWGFVPASDKLLWISVWIWNPVRLTETTECFSTFCLFVYSSSRSIWRRTTYRRCEVPGSSLYSALLSVSHTSSHHSWGTISRVRWTGPSLLQPTPASSDSFSQIWVY